ncbi:hypothetical protein [Caldimonas tepidiphila]|uniref:hypothetical protein n=1 Tax=Caldimonas tepidiphila TaxID=2315841 RepID=UPI0013003EFC|nr:hypothetical protein [Caldimonas tepidiphila]
MQPADKDLTVRSVYRTEELSSIAREDALARIRARLQRDLPSRPYITDTEFASMIGIARKTLANRRAAGHSRYPVPIRLGDGRQALHPRDELIEWLAQEELQQRARTVHRCR